MDHSDVISNTVIIGSSPAYQSVVDAMGPAASMYPLASFCDEANDDGNSPLVGVRLDSYHDGSLFGATGSTLRNVTFSGFGTGSCAGSSALHVDGEDIRYFDTRNTLEDISLLDDSPAINLCGGEQQVAIRDDGSVMGEPGFIISDSDAIRAHPACVSVPNTCAAFCPGICLRTMTVMVPSYYERGFLTLEITGTTADGQDISPLYVEDFQYTYYPNQSGSNGRLFVTLPAGGSYVGRFVTDGQLTWPHYTDLKYEDVDNNCGPDFASFDIEQPVPDQCDSLIRNGDFESGTTDYWLYNGLNGYEIINHGAGSSKSLLAPNPAVGGGQHVGVGQQLDTRCIEEGYVYTFSAMVKLVDASTGDLYECDVIEYGVEAPCPSGNLRFTNRLGEPEHAWELAGRLVTNDSEWNLITGSFVAGAFDAAAHSAYLYITGAPAGVNIQVDDVSFVRSFGTGSPTATPSPSVYGTGSPTATASPSVYQPINPLTAAPVVAVPSPFEGSNTASVTFGTDTVRMATESGVDSAVLTKEAHTGDITFTVEIQSRSIYHSGYQPQLVLFLAPETTSIADVATDDNGFEYFFEPSVVAWFKEKIYYLPDDPDALAYTWFNSKVLDADGNFVSREGSTNIRMTNGGFLRLERSGGSVGSYYSFDGVSWEQFGGGPIPLPASYQTAPLKLGYRIYRQWKPAYDITTHPTIASDGTTYLYE